MGVHENDVPFERGLPVALLRAREAVMFHTRPILRAYGTTEQQWRVLRSLDASEPMDKTSLADRSMLLMPSLLRILKDLKSNGLVRLVRSPSNRRLSGVLLTKRGVQHVFDVGAAISEKNLAVKQAIGESTVENLLSLLREVEMKMKALRDDHAD